MIGSCVILIFFKYLRLPVESRKVHVIGDARRNGWYGKMGNKLVRLDQDWSQSTGKDMSLSSCLPESTLEVIIGLERNQYYTSMIRNSLF